MPKIGAKSSSLSIKRNSRRAPMSISRLEMRSGVFHETYSTEQLEFLVRFYQASIELTKQEIAKLAHADPAEAER